MVLVSLYKFMESSVTISFVRSKDICRVTERCTCLLRVPQDAVQVLVDGFDDDVRVAGKDRDEGSFGEEHPNLREEEEEDEEEEEEGEEEYDDEEYPHRVQHLQHFVLFT
ncbi:hypothetical protein F7725_028372 [Dissostichus mawsoni]|uniref:Uncharacterized protein n=1 Tax=Dissostichus mawsoni TaxID=36200 RepID=A0A7J5XFL7_DISMA|nr:hypothetical protein F7725_028372 [Dissostichus mawsoni]